MKGFFLILWKTQLCFPNSPQILVWWVSSAVRIIHPCLYMYVAFLTSTDSFTFQGWCKLPVQCRPRNQTPPSLALHPSPKWQQVALTFITPTGQIYIPSAPLTHQHHFSRRPQLRLKHTGDKYLPDRKQVPSLSTKPHFHLPTYIKPNAF